MCSTPSSRCSGSTRRPRRLSARPALRPTRPSESQPISTSSADRPKGKGWPKGKPRPQPTSVKANLRKYNFKVCTVCGESKNLEQYNFKYWLKGWKNLRAKDPNKYRDICKDCARQKNAVEVDPNFKPDRGNMLRLRPYKKLTPKEKREQQRVYKQRTRNRARIASLRYLARKGCERCGCKDPRVLEFDHLDPSKKYKSISLLISQGYSWGSQQMRDEVRKCRVLCANCHRLHTVIQQGYYAHDDVKKELDGLLRAGNIDP